MYKLLSVLLFTVWPPYPSCLLVKKKVEKVDGTGIALVVFLAKLLGQFTNCKCLPLRFFPSSRFTPISLQYHRFTKEEYKSLGGSVFITEGSAGL